jgi:hypothetical protein
LIKIPKNKRLINRKKVKNQKMTENHKVIWVIGHVNFRNLKKIIT